MSDVSHPYCFDVPRHALCADFWRTSVSSKDVRSCHVEGACRWRLEEVNASTPSNASAPGGGSEPVVPAVAAGVGPLHHVVATSTSRRLASSNTTVEVVLCDTNRYGPLCSVRPTTAPIVAIGHMCVHGHPLPNLVFASDALSSLSVW